MDKYDIRKAVKDLYTAPKADFVVVEVPSMQYVAVGGHVAGRRHEGVPHSQQGCLGLDDDD